MLAVLSVIVFSQDPIDSNLETETRKMLQKKHLAEIPNVANILVLHVNLSIMLVSLRF